MSFSWRTRKQQDLKVFIPSTYVDPEDQRKKAIEIMNRFKCVVSGMEFLVSQSDDPAKVCKNEVVHRTAGSCVRTGGAWLGRIKYGMQGMRNGHISI